LLLSYTEVGLAVLKLEQRGYVRRCCLVYQSLVNAEKRKEIQMRFIPK
jgi:hypothetical protein